MNAVLVLILAWHAPRASRWPVSHVLVMRVLNFLFLVTFERRLAALPSCSELRLRSYFLCSGSVEQVLPSISPECARAPVTPALDAPSIATVTHPSANSCKHRTSIISRRPQPDLLACDVKQIDGDGQAVQAMQCGQSSREV